MSVISMVVGGATDTSARVVTEVTSVSNVRLAVSTTPTLASPVYFGPVTPTAQNIASVVATGLTPDTRYWWQIEHGGVLDTTFSPGRFHTFPPAGTQASFTIATAGDAGQTPDYPGVGAVLASTRLSNHPVFDTIREADPLMFIHVGDTHYYDMNSGVYAPGGATLANYRRGWSDVMLQPRQHQLYREIPSVFGLDDHDAYGNDLRGLEVPTAAVNCLQVYTERVPSYPLPNSADGWWHAWQIGRVLCINADVRTKATANSATDNSSKTMLGSIQKQWLKNTLESSDAKFLIWFMGSQWSLTTFTDSWYSFQTERGELVSWLRDHGWVKKMCVVYGDRHALGMDSGGNNTDGGFPVLMAASLDAGATDPTPSDRWDLGVDIVGRGQWATISVDDWGSGLGVTFNGMVGNQVWKTHQFAVDTGEGFSASITRAITGSHEATFDARVVTDFQIGADPAGTTIPILGGDVQLDATAEVRGTLDLTTDGDGKWPGGKADLLAPYGNEVFVRRGVLTAAGATQWVPLGYYRIDTDEQDDTVDGPIHMSLRDRMAGIIDDRFLTPRQYDGTRTYGSVVLELVREVYPLAAIIWDDDTHLDVTGRTLVAEESRYDLLADIARSVGKIMYFDGAGVLRIRAVPDAATPVWDVFSGAGGVLVKAARRLSRQDAYNGVVATGDAADTEVPPRGFAFDDNPASPTWWGGRFGHVVRFYASPLITSNAQAGTAARAILQRYMGVPYSVDFSAVPHPQLQPFDPVRVRQPDGGLRIHVIDRLTIPLSADAALQASTREQALISLAVE